MTAAREISRAALAQADQEAASAAIFRAKADSASARADSALQASRKVQIRYIAAKIAAPDTCRPALALADSVISDLQDANTALDETAGHLRTALDSTTVALQRLRASQVNLDAKAGILVGASKPSLLSKAIPKPGIGAFAGVDASGRPTFGVGITLGWSR